MKHFNSFYIFITLFCCILSCKQPTVNNPIIESPEKIIVAYVTAWSEIIPDPEYITHINYAFGHVNDSFNGVNVDNEARLQEIIQLKNENPALKVSLSVGGWGSGRFSEMAADSITRFEFVADCQRLIQLYNLDGIDLDWEYPTQSSARISSSPDDTDNFTLLMQELRTAIGDDKLLTLASVASAKYVDFNSILPVIDFVNIMSYDMYGKDTHHAALFRSPIAGWMTCEEAVDAHLNAGIPAEKLTMGLPFYGRGNKKFATYLDYNKLNPSEEYIKMWDDSAKVPYLVNSDNEFIFGYDDPESLALKCQFIKSRNLLGAMYWEYAADNSDKDLQRTVFVELND